MAHFYMIDGVVEVIFCRTPAGRPMCIVSTIDHNQPPLEMARILRLAAEWFELAEKEGWRT